MAQVKIYGLAQVLPQKRQALSTAIHESLMEAFGLPENKKFHRYIMLDRENYIFPDDRSEQYTIIEISIFSGRSSEAKKRLLSLLFSNIKRLAGIDGQDVEITIYENRMANWGIRGIPGDELALNYNVKV